MEISFVMPLAVFGGVVLGTVAIHSVIVRQPRAIRDRIERYEAGVNTVAMPRVMPSLLKDSRHSTIGWLDQLLQKSNFADKMALDLAQAAVPLRVAEYILVRWLSALGMASMALLFGKVLLVAVIAGIMGFYLPKFYLSYKRQKRLKTITNQLIDAITLIANSLKSGYSFPQGLELVTREMPPPIADELHQVLAEMNLGSSAEQALNNLTKRVPNYDVDLLVTALIIQRQVGGNLAEVLENIAHTIRERIRILGEVRTRTAQARFSGYIIGLMPFFLMGAISLLNPTYLRELFASPLGLAMLGAALAMELVGFFLIRRIVAIEV